LYALNDGVYGLDEGSFLERDFVGQTDDTSLGDPGHGFDVFGEAAAVGGEAGSEAGGLVLFALREETAFAIETFSARDVVKAHHAVAEFPFGDAAADGDDGACEFVAEDLGRGDIGVVDFLMSVPQMPQAATLMRTSPSVTSGTGTSSTRTIPFSRLDAGPHGFWGWGRVSWAESSAAVMRLIGPVSPGQNVIRRPLAKNDPENSRETPQRACFSVQNVLAREWSLGR